VDSMNSSDCSWTIDVQGLIEASKLHETVVLLAEQAVRSNDRSMLAKILSQLEGHAIDEVLVKAIDRYIDFLHPGMKKIASVSAQRLPAPGELVIKFGNYPIGFINLPVNNPMRRNIVEFADFKLDAVESAQCWDPINRIFIINRDDRPDRYYSCLRELARMGAPLDRITRFTACIGLAGIGPDIDLTVLTLGGLRWIKRSLTGYPWPGRTQLNGTIGCLRSHLGVVRLAQQQGLENVLILEDDFCFTDDSASHQNALSTFFERRYSYDVCLLSTAYDGLIVPKDDLVSVTRQSCTNASGYMVSREGIPKLVDCFSKALPALIERCDPLRFAVDRCWNQFQGERFLVFKSRIGFQSPSYSDIEGVITADHEALGPSVRVNH
jgi:hypothetical protein